MQLGTNQLYLLHLAEKNDGITKKDVYNVYRFPRKYADVKTRFILDKLEFLKLIKETDEKIGFHNLSVYVLTKKGRRVLKQFSRGASDD